MFESISTLPNYTFSQIFMRIVEYKDQIMTS